MSGRKKRVDLEQHKATAPRLLDDVRLQRVVDRQLLHLEPELLGEILEREFLKGEVVALEVLRDGEAERGGRVLVHRVEDFDPHVDVAIGLRPVARAVVQQVRHEPLGRDGGEDGDRRQGEHVWVQLHSVSRTARGQRSTSSPCVLNMASVSRSMPKPTQAVCAVSPSAVRRSQPTPKWSWW